MDINRFTEKVQQALSAAQTKAVRYGEPTYDEMMIGWLDYTTDNEKAKPDAAMNK